MNNRRKLIVALGASALGAPLASFAQQPGKVWRLGFLGTASASGYVKETDAIRARLRDLGWVEGKNIIIEYRWAESDPQRLREMAAEIVALKVDVIITHSFPGARAAGQATKTIPIVIADGPDPVAAGLVASLARPGYGANRPLLYGRAASFVDRILRGAKPGDLPIERATNFDLIVNVRAAKALGVRIPPQLLQRADKVIE